MEWVHLLARTKLANEALFPKYRIPTEHVVQLECSLVYHKDPSITVAFTRGLLAIYPNVGTEEHISEDISETIHQVRSDCTSRSCTDYILAFSRAGGHQSHQQWFRIDGGMHV